MTDADDKRQAAAFVRDKLHTRLRRIARDAVTYGMARDDVAACFEAIVDEYRDSKPKGA